MKILIIYTSAGAGHKKAAEGLYKAFLENTDERPTIVDALRFTNPFFRWTYPHTYLFLVKYTPLIWGFFFYLLNIKALLPLFSLLRRWINYLNTISLEEFFLKEKPEIVITTHFLPMEVLASLKKRGRFSGKLITCVTDLVVHSFWISKDVDLYIAGIDDTKAELIRWGISPAKIEVLGIPIDPVFAEKNEKGLLCDRLKVDRDYQNILITSGGFGVGPIKGLVERLSELGGRFQLLIVCGKNKRLYEDIKRIAPRLKMKTKVYGFVDNMDELMELSEVIVTKPGGLTTQEALAKTLPIISVSPIPGQESGNLEILLRYGAGFAARSLDEVVGIIKDLFLSGMLNEVKEKVRAIARPEASKAIVGFVVGSGLNILQN